jgi:WD40 repeat protein/tRNA A-37 threonylcarbamoyl transferase component Bud32
MSGTKFGRYEIIAELGRGGMATVFHAYDPHFERDVAVKVLPREYLHHPSARPRFEREAKSVAALEHAAIVPVYDYGEEDGQPYLVMRFMTGGSLGHRLHNGALTVREAAPILTRVGAALDEAHAQGIIHRDIKPDNILFDKRGEAYLADFGIVKSMGASISLTGEDLLMGTPAYMSPEQVEGEVEPDGRSDIYALGIVLFEMLTGDAPFDASTPAKLLIKHVLDPVPSILAVKPDLPPDCERVIARVLAKNRADRYSTGGAFARDLEALAGGTVMPATAPMTPSSAPAPAALEAEKTHTLRGHKDTIWSVAWSPDGAQLASGSYDGKIILWDTQTGAQTSAFETLGRTPGGVWAALQTSAQGVRSVAWSPNGAMLASGSDDGIVTIWDVRSGEQLGTLGEQERGVRSIAWSPDGSMFASGSDDGIVVVWDVQTGNPVSRMEEHTRGVRSVVWSPDGAQLASGSYDGRVIIWNARTGERVSSLEGHTRGVRSVAWSPDGARLVSARHDGALTLWDAQSAQQLGSLEGHTESVHSVTWSPDGKQLVSGANDGTLIVWEVGAGQQVGTLQAHADAIRSVAWSPDGTRLATCSDDHLVIVWQLASG